MGALRGKRWWVVALGLLLGGPAASGADVPLGPSDVYVQGSQLMVRKRLPDGSLDVARPYVIQGVSWSPATRAPAEGPSPLDPSDTVPYGFFFDWPGRVPPGHEVLRFWMDSQFPVWAQTDLDLMQQMHVNTVRVYTDLGDDVTAARALLDACYEHDVMVIVTVANSREELEDGRHLDVVQRHNDHPAILMWSLGNEWNLNRYYGYPDIVSAALATQRAAQAIKALDASHPVSSSLGDIPSQMAQILTTAAAVDLWGLNVYRGPSFGTLFTQWAALTPKPFYLGEFGTDSFRSTGYQVFEGRKAIEVTGVEDHAQQADLARGLWKELIPHLSARLPEESCVGGLVHEFNDALWKVGNFHAGLGMPTSPTDWYQGNTSYDENTPEGFVLPGSHPDDVANEEFFGVVDADRNPKQAFHVLQQLYTPAGPVLLFSDDFPATVEGEPLTFTVSATDPNLDLLTVTALSLPLGARFDDVIRDEPGVIEKRLAWTPAADQSGTYPVTFTASDGRFEAAESVVLTVQEASLAIAGTVRDAQGQPVAGIHVTLKKTGAAQRRITSTGANGTYLFGDLKRGASYTITPKSPAWRLKPASRMVPRLTRDRRTADFTALPR